MCGIWALFTSSAYNIQSTYDAFNAIKNRGPDRSHFIEYGHPYNCKLGFHRLSIMDPSFNGDQPFVHEIIDPINGNINRIIMVLCNGEIYNYKDIAKEYDIDINQFKSGSDCEIIGHLYIKTGG